MSRGLKIFLIVCLSMIVLGLAFLGVGFFWGVKEGIYIDRDGLHMGLERRDQNFSDLGTINSLVLDIDYTNVRLVPSDHFAIEYIYYQDKDELKVEVENNHAIVSNRPRGWVFFNLYFRSHKNELVIYYPDTLINLDLNIDSGNLDAEGLILDYFNIDHDLGEINLRNIEAKEAEIDHDSGRLKIEGGTFGRFNIDQDLGSVHLSQLKIDDLNINLDSGSLKIENSEIQSAQFDQDLGDLHLQGVTTYQLIGKISAGSFKATGSFAGKTKIVSDLGSVRLTTDLSQETYQYQLSTSLGKTYINNEKVGNTSNTQPADNRIEIKASSGDIHLNFASSDQND